MEKKCLTYYSIFVVFYLYVAITSHSMYSTGYLGLNPFQTSVAFHIETSHFFCSAKQMTGFYMKHNTRLKWTNQIYVSSLNMSTSTIKFYLNLNIVEKDFILR